MSILYVMTIGTKIEEVQVFSKINKINTNPEYHSENKQNALKITTKTNYKN